MTLIKLLCAALCTYLIRIILIHQRERIHLITADNYYTGLFTFSRDIAQTWVESSFSISISVPRLIMLPAENGAFGVI